jgi:hypothetical protein
MGMATSSSTTCQIGRGRAHEWLVGCCCCEGAVVALATIDEVPCQAKGEQEKHLRCSHLKHLRLASTALASRISCVARISSTCVSHLQSTSEWNAEHVQSEIPSMSASL